MKKNIRNILVIALAVCICAGVGLKASDARLKASEELPEAETVVENVDEVVEETVEPETATEQPEEVTEVEVEVPAEAEEEKTEAEEEKTEAEEEKTEAEEEKTESEEEKTTEAEEEAPVEKSITTWFEYDKDNVYLGMTIVIRSSIQGYSDDVAYKWQYTIDGVNWFDAENGNDASYTFVLDETTCTYKWRLGVYDYNPIVETPAESEAA